jgi:hypothetical protein
MAISDKVREYALITFIKPTRNRAKKNRVAPSIGYLI